MDVSRDFFSKLRALALTLEKETQQLERALRGEDPDYEGESPIRLLHDLRCEIMTLKEDVNASLRKSCSEKQAIHEFMKASEILMQRNAADLGKIRELFQKYGYKPQVVNSDSTVSVQNKSDEEKADDVPHLPACTEKSLVPKDPLRTPQLSDFGLSQYAFSRPWIAVKEQCATSAHQENSKNRTPLKTQTTYVLPKTPKCMLKMDDYECVTPKLEHFGISEHVTCMNEDYTMSLIRKTAQTSKNENAQYISDLLLSLTLDLDLRMCCLQQILHIQFKGFKSFRNTDPEKKLLKHSVKCLIVETVLVKKDDHEVNVPEIISREIMVTPGPKSNVMAENADWMASPMMLVFCTPDVKICSRTNSTVLSRSPETNELPPPSHTRTPELPDFETRWLKTEAKVVNSNYVHFHTLLTINSFSSQGGKIESVTKDDTTDKQYIEDNIPFVVSSDEYLKHFGDPSPPKIKHYDDQLLNTPPSPEITRIPDDVLQILSKYNKKVDSYKAKEMETKAANTTRSERDFTDDCHKENR
ncbi:SKA3 protein, partial [Herpetotheres cachinnans]|nr:SKA3 protein [Herpetotheres cachinnans]